MLEQREIVLQFVTSADVRSKDKKDQCKNQDKDNVLMEMSANIGQDESQKSYEQSKIEDKENLRRKHVRQFADVRLKDREGKNWYYNQDRSNFLMEMLANVKQDECQTIGQSKIESGESSRRQRKQKQKYVQQFPTSGDTSSNVRPIVKNWYTNQESSNALIEIHTNVGQDEYQIIEQSKIEGNENPRRPRKQKCATFIDDIQNQNIRPKDQVDNDWNSDQDKGNFLMEMYANSGQGELSIAEQSRIEEHSENLRKRREQKRKYAEQRLRQETPEQKAARLQAQNHRVRKSRESETSWQRASRLEAQRIRARIRRAQETPEQRETRLMSQRERSAVKRAKETPEQRQTRLENVRNRYYSRKMESLPTMVELDAGTSCGLLGFYRELHGEDCGVGPNDPT